MKKSGIILIIVCAIAAGYLLVISYSEPKQNDIIPNEINKMPEVYFCAFENCTYVLHELISSAKISIHCAFFDLDIKNILALLAEKSKTTDVKVVIDGDNDNGEELEFIRYDTEGQLMHNKFCAIDDETVFTGSFNPTANGESKNDNNVIVLYSKYLFMNYEEEFRELWAGHFGTGDKTRFNEIILNNRTIENYFCPDDCVIDNNRHPGGGNAVQRVRRLLSDAKESISFMTFALTSEDVADAMLLNRNNASISGIVDRMQAAQKYSQYRRLKDFGMDVELDNNPALMHHKVFIIDNKTVITGSWNPTNAAISNNDENIIIIHDNGIAGRYTKEFYRIKGYNKRDNKEK